MKALKDLKELKEMYEMELDDLHVYEGDPRIKELREAALQFQIVMVEDQICKLEEKRKSLIQVITATVVAVFVLFIVYLIF
jgi:hypothetical protein